MAGAWEQADHWGGAAGLLGLLPCVALEMGVERTVEAMVSLMDSRGVIIIQGEGTCFRTATWLPCSPEIQVLIWGAGTQPPRPHVKHK